MGGRRCADRRPHLATRVRAAPPSTTTRADGYYGPAETRRRSSCCYASRAPRAWRHARDAGAAGGVAAAAPAGLAPQIVLQGNWSARPRNAQGEPADFRRGERSGRAGPQRQRHRRLRARHCRALSVGVPSGVPGRGPLRDAGLLLSVVSSSFAREQPVIALHCYFSVFPPIIKNI